MLPEANAVWSPSLSCKVPAGGVGSGDDSACAGEFLGSGADGRPNSSFVASAGGAFAGRSRTAEGQCDSAALLRASGRLRQAEAAVVAATSGDSVGTIGLHQVIESARTSLIHESSLARSCADVGGSCAVGVASVSAAPCVAALHAGRSLTYARAAANACGEVARGSNSWSDTAVNSLRVQRSSSYNPQGVVAPNSRRQVRLSSTVGSRSVVQTVDMSPAPAAGTSRRSAGTVHAQRQVPRKRLAGSSGVGAGPGPGPGGRSGRVGGVSGLAAACLEIPCSLVMPPGRHQFAPQSLGWARVCGTGKSGVWVLKGDARTYNLPRNLDDVGVVWESRSGYETAWATPGHVCSCSYSYGRGAVLLIPPFLQRRLTCGAGSHPF